MFEKRAKIWLTDFLLILFLIAAPMPEYNGTKETYYDKVVHFLLFGSFVFACAWWLEGRPLNKRLQLFLALSAGVVYAGLGEFIQIFVPGRTVSEWDFLAGAAGSLSAFIFLYAWTKA